MQFLFVNLAGLLLGRKYGPLSVAVYIVAGLAGFPVFAKGGGLWYVFEPTFGYLLGFLAATFLTGLIAEKTTPSFKSALAAGFPSFFVMYALGLSYFYLIRNFYMTDSPITLNALIVTCFLPFAVGDILSLVLCAVVYKRLKKVL